MARGRVSSLRQALQQRGLTAEAQQLVEASWRGQTPAKYDAAWNQWLKYCREAKVTEPHNPSVAELTNYVANLAQRNLKGRTVATYLNSIASQLALLGCFAASDPVVRRAIRGACQMRPSKAKYAEFWDPKVLCDYIESLGENETMSIVELMDKVNALMHIGFAARSSCLVHIDLNLSAFVDGGLRIAFGGARKQTAPGNLPDQVFLPRANRLLCPVAAVHELLHATEAWRQRDTSKPDRPYQPQYNGLFLAQHKPHQNLIADSIARRFHLLMGAAGIDTDKYGAHSARGATATKLIQQGATVDEAMRVGGWSSVKVFRDFYNRAVQPLNTIATVSGERVPRPERTGGVVFA